MDRRRYRQTARAESAAHNAAAVLAAAQHLLATRWYDDVTLADIAHDAGVSVKTVQRQFGSKDAIARDVFIAFARENSEWRDQVPAGDIDHAIEAIVGMYEHIGDAIIRYLALELRSEIVAELLETGRRLHRDWVERVFASLLVASGGRAEAIATAVVATDVYTWKLLRRDAGLSRARTIHCMKRIALAAQRKTQEHR